MTYKLSTNLAMKGFPRAAVAQFFTEIDDLLKEVKESLQRCPEMVLTIEAET